MLRLSKTNCDGRMPFFVTFCDGRIPLFCVTAIGANVTLFVTDNDPNCDGRMLRIMSQNVTHHTPTSVTVCVTDNRWLFRIIHYNINYSPELIAIDVGLLFVYIVLYVQ